jgi:competence protein ComEC
VAGRLAATGTYLNGWFFRWPFAWARIFTPSILELALAYGFLMLWPSRPLKGEQLANQIRGRYRSLGRASKPEFLHWRGTAAGVLAAVLITDAVWWNYQRYFNPDLRVTFLSVGEGDAAVVRFPGSRVILIDGGGGFSRTFDPGERVVAPFLWSNKIMHVDYIALSHPDHDHFGGLIFIAQNFSPSEFWTGGTASRDESYRELISALDVAAARTRVCNSASATMMIGRVTVRCLGPLAGVPERKDNNASMAIRLGYGLSSFLFSGDLEAKGERELIASGATLLSTILKVPHHGSHTSSSEALVKAVHPEAAVTSLGYHNRFHFPAPEVVARYKDEGALFLRTDESGAVSVDAEPNSLSLWTFRNGVRAFLSPANRLRRLVQLTP